MATKPVTVSLVNAGRLAYQKGLNLQKILVDRHTDRSIPEDKRNSLILIEHNPVYTIGIRTAPYPDSEIRRLEALGAEFHKTNRGGLITFHGPGQLVCYPIINLRHFDLTVKKYVCLLEKSVIQVCDEYKIEARRTEDTGIWVGNRKICAMGIHAQRFITSHGLALNCNTDLNWFNNIVPCGLVGKGVTSLSNELGRDVDIKAASAIFLKSFADTFNCQFVETSDESLAEIICHNKNC